MDTAVPCTSCGHAIDLAGALPGARVTCPLCKAVHRISDRPPPAQIDWDDRPYADSPKADSRCPQCGAALDTAAALCPACGCDLDIAPAPPAPIKHAWGPVPSYEARLGMFIAYELVVVGMALLLGYTDDWSALHLIIHGLAVSALAAVCLGTVEQLDLKRTYEGRVSLTRTRHVGFIPWSTTKISPRGYETMATSESIDQSATDWLMAMWLVSLGCIPGIVWIIVLFTRPVYQVALTKDHGMPALILYHGRDKERMREVAEAISEVWRFRVRP